jgi:RecA/RadA recombinase
MNEFEFYKSVADSAHLHDEIAKYEKANTVSFGISFLDEALGGLSPSDLFVIGGGTGGGKSELAVTIAANAAAKNRRVKFFALEAEKHEIAMRLLFRKFKKWSIDNPRAYAKQHISFQSFMMGEPQSEIEKFRNSGDSNLDEYRNLDVKYSIFSFTIHDLEKSLLECQNNADLVVIDHLHYFDLDGDNENAEIKSILKMIRSFCLDFKIPVVLVSHIRKQNETVQKITPSADDFHGSSDIIKIASKGLTIASPPFVDCLKISSYDEKNNPVFESIDLHFRPTFMRAVKFRREGMVTSLTALCEFDHETKTYGQKYILGRPVHSGRQVSFLAIKESQKPYWAKSLFPIFSAELDKTKKEL